MVRALVVFAFVISVGFGTVACKEETAMEKAAQTMEEAAEDAKDAAEDLADEAEKAME